MSWFNGKLEKKGEFTLYRLVRFIRAKRPDIVAIDSVTELGDDLRKFLRALPPGTKLVQVTGKPGEQRTLQSLAREHGIRTGDRFDPYEEAKLAALLASRGVGYEVLAFEDEVIVKVTRGRSHGKGGWSQDRYRKRVHNLVRDKVREIEDRLRRADIPFDLETEEKDYGLARGEFRVYASREELAGLIRPMRGGDVEVRIQPVERAELGFAPLKKEEAIRQRKSLIVGIDPGITVGIAAIDLDGRIVALHSERNMPVGEVFRFISELGHPVIIATDVSPAPGFVEKIARSFKAQLFVPRESLRVEEKNELLRNLGITVDDDHQRDALAAAYKAYLRIKPKLEHIDSRLREAGLSKKSDEVKALVIAGYNLGEAMQRVTLRERKREEEEEPEVEKSFDAEPYLKRIRELERRVEFLERENEELREIIREQRKTIGKLERKIADYDEEVRRKVLREKELEAKVKRIELLEKQLREAKAVIERLSRDLVQVKRMNVVEVRGSAVPLKVLRVLSWRELERIEREVGLRRGDVLFVVNPAGAGKAIAEELVGREIRAIITEKPLPETVRKVFREAHVPFFTSEELDVKRVDEFAVVERETLERAIGELLERWRKEDEEREAERFLRLLEEYRIERAKELERKAREELEKKRRKDFKP
ncbi:putative RNase H-like nuclease (RuvC/YqgF family) [Thermococcus stetteri]|nr:putative RNase H-like nuclease (RuvC/YqgF family) [Thermococcus stetteri]